MFVCAFYLFIYSSTRTLKRPSYKISYHAQEVESGFGGGNKNYQGVFNVLFPSERFIYMLKLDSILFCLAVEDTA